jgi:hypothetical protein
MFDDKTNLPVISKICEEIKTTEDSIVILLVAGFG